MFKFKFLSRSEQHYFMNHLTLCGAEPRIAQDRLCCRTPSVSLLSVASVMDYGDSRRSFPNFIVGESAMSVLFNTSFLPPCRGTMRPQ